jgi:hypothetical protein
MPRIPFLGVLLAASLLAPLPAGAQSPGPSYAPLELTADDLGTWDVELTARSPIGSRPRTVRGVETNTIGCDGRCIVTKVDGPLKTATASRGSSSPWWRDYDGSSPGGLAFKQTGLQDTVAASSEVAVDPVPLATRFPASRTAQMTNGSRAVRISVDYPDPDRRIVTTFSIGPDGKEIQTARIVYTRRR